MAVKMSKVEQLFDSLIDVMAQEIEMAKGDEGIPLAASDKAVILAVVKHCGVTAEPDSDAMQTLKNAFSTDLEEKRAARAKLLVQQTESDDGISMLMQ